MPGAFFQQNIKSISKISRDKWGDISTTILYQNVPCRFSYDTLRVRRAMLEDEQVDALAYVGKDYQLAVDYVVDFDNDDYIIVKIFKETDLFGNVHHQRLALRSRG